jgi:hypothetical protein
MIRVFLPVRTVSLLNMREHFRVSAKRKAAHRHCVRLVMHGQPVPDLPVTVTLTRISWGKLDEHDNLPSAFKHVVDELAAWLGIDDADKRVTWRYAQKKGMRGEYGVVVEVFA